MAVQYDTTNHWRVITQMHGSQWKKVRDKQRMGQKKGIFNYPSIRNTHHRRRVLLITIVGFDFLVFAVVFV
jgi:hypothetical protein